MFITLTILPTPLRCFEELVHFISKLVFTVRLLSVMRDHSFFFPATTANNLWLRVRRISFPDFIHSIFLSFLILQKEPVFPFLMLSVKQGNYWYHFILSLVWRGHWLGIEPGTSRTRSHYSTTRLSRSRWNEMVLLCSCIFLVNTVAVLAATLGEKSHLEIRGVKFRCSSWGPIAKRAIHSRPECTSTSAQAWLWIMAKPLTDNHHNNQWPNVEYSASNTIHEGPLLINQEIEMGKHYWVCCNLRIFYKWDDD